MAQSELQYVVRMLIDMNLRAVARKAGLSYQTVWSIASGENTDPSYDTVRKLSAYFKERESAATA